MAVDGLDSIVALAEGCHSNSKISSKPRCLPECGDAVDFVGAAEAGAEVGRSRPWSSSGIY